MLITPNNANRSEGLFVRFIEYFKEQKKLHRELNEKGLSGFFEETHKTKERITKGSSARAA